MGGGAGALLLLLLLLLARARGAQAGPGRRGRGAPQEPRGRGPGPADAALLSEPCGVRPVRGLILGGAESRRGRWPWLALVRMPNVKQCAGSLLGRRWVLTAAHCFGGSPDASKWLVQLGELTMRPSLWNLRSYLNRYRVRDIILSPRAGGSSHDIALLRLASSVTYTKYIQPVCIPSATSAFLHRPDCWVAGWGVTQENLEPLPAPYNLREVQVTVMNNSRCLDLFTTSPYRDYIHLDAFCAGAEDGSADACKGDSGAPLVCDLDGLWYQVGIVSWGEGCGQPLRPGIYTNVSYHFDWIWMLTSHGTPWPDTPLPPFLTLTWASWLLAVLSS